ncbi:MAG: hypothetical protein ACFFDP_04030 [Promethearchaeota archaeon]
MSGSKASKRTVNWDRIFGGIASATFALQLISIMILVAAGIVFVMMISGLFYFFMTNIDFLILLLLIVAGLSFLIFIVLLGFFLNTHIRIRGFLIGRGVGDVDADSSATKTILGMFAISIIFVLSAGVYSFYMIWKYFLDPWGVNFLTSYGLVGNFIYEWGILIVFLAVGVIYVCIIMQLLTAVVNRVTDRLVKSAKK